MGVKADPTTAAARWQQNFAAAGQRAAAGVDAVTTAPGQLAAKQAAVWAANVASAQQKFARNVASVSLSAWQEAYKTTGVARFASGAQKGAPKMAQFQTAFLPFLSSAVNSLPPRGSYEQNKQRSIALMDKVHTFTYNKG